MHNLTTSSDCLCFKKHKIIAMKCYMLLQSQYYYIPLANYGKKKSYE